MYCNEAWDGEYSKRNRVVSVGLANGPAKRSGPGTGKYGPKYDYADINAQSFSKTMRRLHTARLSRASACIISSFFHTFPCFCHFFPV
jgi:hypothetical protein